MYAPGQLTVVFLLSTIIRDKLDQPQIVSPAAGRAASPARHESRSDCATMNNISERNTIYTAAAGSSSSICTRFYLSSSPHKYPSFAFILRGRSYAVSVNPGAMISPICRSSVEMLMMNAAIKLSPPITIDQSINQSIKYNRLCCVVAEVHR